MTHLPIFVDVAGHTCLVVGGGEVAARKVEQLLHSGARVIVVAPELGPSLRRWVAEERAEHQPRPFAPADLDGARLVFAASDDSGLNEEVSRLAQARGVLVNVVDSPALCTFIMPSVIRRLPVQVAVSTGGAAPVLARLLRARLETMIPSAYGELAALMGAFREKVRARFPSTTRRRRFWEHILEGPVAEMLFAGQRKAALDALESRLADEATRPELRGEVYLVGGGPGDPDLLTFRALRLMQQADVVVYDRLVAPAVVDLARREAERIYVGKATDQHTVSQEEINDLLARLAREGKRVLRLKGGDPFIFGRGGEEIETLAVQGIPFQVVPGITAASGCACYAGIPLTHRDYAQSCIFVTGHLKDDALDLNWEALVQPRQTIAVYMGVKALAVLCAELVRHGMSADTPAAIVEQGTTPRQRVIVGTLSTLPERVARVKVRPPSLTIIGEVVRLHEKLAWFEQPPEEAVAQTDRSMST